MKIMSVKVKPDLWSSFEAACKPFTVSVVIRLLMEKFLSGEIKLQIAIGDKDTLGD